MAPLVLVPVLGALLPESVRFLVMRGNAEERRRRIGGMKNSGYDRFDGRAVIDEFTELKWITIEPLKQQYPI